MRIVFHVHCVVRVCMLMAMLPVVLSVVLVPIFVVVIIVFIVPVLFIVVFHMRMSLIILPSVWVVYMLMSRVMMMVAKLLMQSERASCAVGLFFNDEDAEGVDAKSK